MISSLTENLKVCESAADRGRCVISGKRDMMQLLVEKTLEYHRIVDPNAETVLSELATQYETLVDQAINLVSEAGFDQTGDISGNRGRSMGGASNAATQRQLREKDREIKRLQE